MPYSKEIIVHTVLERRFGIASATGICEFLPRPHFATCLNIRWNLRLLADPPGSDEVRHLTESKFLANKRVNVRKARKLALAVMEVGYRALSFPFSNGGVVDDNFALVRLLCQGPWNRPGSVYERRIQSYRLAFHLQLCFRMLVDGMNYTRPGAVLHPHDALLDIYSLEVIFIRVSEVLTWAGVMTPEFEDTRPYFFDVDLYFENDLCRWGSDDAEQYYMERFRVRNW